MRGPKVLDIGPAHDFDNDLIELVDDVDGCAFGGHEAKPNGGLKLGDPRLGQCRDIGHDGRAAMSTGGNGTHFVVFDKLGHGGDGIKHHVDLATYQIGSGA